MSKATKIQLDSATDHALNYIVGLDDGARSEQLIHDIAASRSRLILKEWATSQGVVVFADETNLLNPLGEQIHGAIRVVVASVKPK